MYIYSTDHFSCPQLSQSKDIHYLSFIHFTLTFLITSVFQTVSEAHKICKEMNIPFPPVVATPEDAETPNDFYVFRGVNTPTVIHMPLFNTGNCKGKTLVYILLMHHK